MRLSFPAVLAGVIGLVFLVIGMFIGYVTPNDVLRQAARIEGLPVVVAQSFEDRQPGDEVVIEGQVSSRNKPLFREYAAYYREEYRGEDDDGDPLWREDERQAPPIVIDLPDGRVQIANDGYSLNQPLVQWQDQDHLAWDMFARVGTKRYYGVQVGDAVLAVGSVVAGREGPELRAELLAGGSRAAYVESQRSAAGMARWVGLAFGSVGVICLVIGLIIAIRDR